MARTLVLGRVKQRLAADIGNIGAWRFYRQTLARTLRLAGTLPGCCVWLDATGAPRAMPAGRYRLRHQVRGDIGERMESSLRSLPPGDAILIGTDIPGIERRHLLRAFAALRQAPVVFGPTADGGFWLVGVRRVPGVPRPLFRPGIRWSTGHALADAVVGLQRAYRLVDRLRDVDRAADLPQRKAG